MAGVFESDRPGTSRCSPLVATIGRAAGGLRRWIVAAPGTHIYLLVLLVTTQTVRALHPALATELLRAASTNLFQMGRNAGRVLFLSAFLLAEGGWWVALVLFSLVYAPLEHRIGTWRWLAVATVGHVGATLVTTVGIWADVHSNAGATQLARSIDVGVSYGVFAAAALLSFVIGARWLRYGLRAVLMVALGIPLVWSHTFTDVGHAAAACLGAATWLPLGPGIRIRRARRAPAWSWSAGADLGAPGPARTAR